MINLELWNECNSNCLFCRMADGRIFDQNPNGSGADIPKGKMPFELYTEIISQVKDYLLMAVLYINGEPLLYKELFKVVKFATENRVATTISTNGILLNKKNITQLLESGIDFVKIAVSGYTQDVYCIQHRYGNIEKIKDNIRVMSSMSRDGGYGVIIMVDYILYRHNRHELELFRDFCREAGVMFNVRPGNPKGMEQTEPPRILNPIPLKVPCDFLWKVLSINWNGDILPCCDCVIWSGMEPYEKFKVNETDVAAVWNGEKAVRFRTIHAAKGRRVIPICSSCQRRGSLFKF